MSKLKLRYHVVTFKVLMWSIAMILGALLLTSDFLAKLGLIDDNESPPSPPPGARHPTPPIGGV